MPETRLWLVGAGPGDPDLLTVKAARLIANADIILHDALVGDAVLALARPGAALWPVGKRAGRHSMPQAAICASLVAAARTGGRVVRLKGGDPAIFGRLGEEIDALRRAGLAFEIVPGVTAACAAAAAAQVSLSRRGSARRVSFVTGHVRDGEPLDLDWAALADPGATVAVYMGKASAPKIAAALVAHGLDDATPAVAVENAGCGEQRIVVATLASLTHDLADCGDGPLMIMIGAAVGGGTPARARKATGVHAMIP
jgi:uroporphyrin-III C-methyltransferase